MRKPLKLVVLGLSVLVALFHISCNTDDDSNSNCENIACTEQFVTIVISIKDQNQDPVALESFRVINSEDGSDVTIPLSPSGLEMAQELGQYPLISDGGVEINQELQLQFKGFMNNQEVISSDYTVSADCCHIDLVSGDLQLVL